MIWLGNPPRRNACRPVTMSVAGLLLATSAHAQEPKPIGEPEALESTRVFVQYAAPEGCPSQTLFEGALYFRSPRVAFVSRAEESAVRASVRIVPGSKPGSYSGVLELESGEGAPSTRALEGSRCATVVEALSLAAALLLDPAGVRTAPLPSALELEALAEKARVDAAPVGEPAPAEPEPKPAAAPEPVPVAKPAPQRERAPAAASSRFGLSLRGGFFTAVHGLDGLAGLGAEYGAPLASSEISGRLSALASVQHEVSEPAGTVTYLPFELQAGACLGPKPKRLEIAACVDAALLLLAVDAPETDEPRPSLRLLPTLDLSPRVAYRFGQVALGLEVGGGVHLTAEHFRIEPDGEVFALPRFFGRSILFLRFDMPVGDPSARFGG